MIAKLIAHAPTRAAAIDRLADALARSVVVGPRTNTAFLAALLTSEEFRSEKFDTGFIERNLAALGAVPREPDAAAAARGVAHLLSRERTQHAAIDDGENLPPSPWDAADGFQLSGIRAVDWPIIVDDRPMTARVRYGSGGPSVKVGDADAAADATIVDAGNSVYVVRGGRQTMVARAGFDDAGAAAPGGGTLRAPMHGKVLAVLVAKGAAVRKGEQVAIIEAMKMEHALVAPFDGSVAEVGVATGDQIAEKAIVMIIEPVA
jgi:3-methylcrotonyl-CoA carboxylase alpha subunit